MEKARDIAIMRAIGIPRGSVTAIFLIEGIVVGIVGMGLGWLAGWGLGVIIHMIPAPTGHAGDLMPVRLELSLFASASVIALLSSVGAAWLPARRAARADPLTIIRGAA
jgi:lipoprotein-releasing system permease protein